MTHFPRRFAFPLTLAAVALAGAAGWSIVRAADNAPAPTVGADAPKFSLPDQDGTLHTSAQDKGKVVLLAFYPADFTGGCTIEAHALSAAYPQFKQMGVKVYGVSVQDSKSHKDFCTKEGIPYTLLADTEKVAAKAFGVFLPGPAIASRVTYIIGKDGKVAYVDTAVNSHLLSCGTDWIAWLKAHPAVLAQKTASVPYSDFVLTQGHGLSSTPTTNVKANFGSKFGTRLALQGPAHVSEPAPAFTLPDVITHKPTSLESLVAAHKATVVLFVATRCPYSNGYNARMAALAKKYGAKGAQFVGINSNTTEPVAECAAHAKAHLPFPVLKDADDKVADAYAAKVTPEAYVIDAHGTLLYHGRIDNALEPRDVVTHDLANALDAVLAHRPVSQSQPAAFGCSIKRAS